MKHGVCTWIFGGTGLDEVAPRLAEIGYDGVELMGDLEGQTPDQVRASLDPFSLSVLSLTPEDVDLAHPDPEKRKEAVDYYLRLLDFAKAVGSPMAACHGAVGRIRPLSTQAEEEAHLLSGVKKIARKAEDLGLRICMEVLNRYESHLLNTAAQAVRFVRAVDSLAVGILMDTYHMNIEEPDPVAALHTAKDRLFCFHAADSNRRAPGRGHLPFPSLVRALDQIGYDGPAVVECTAPGPDPFTPDKGPDFLEQVFDEVAFSLETLRRYESVVAGPKAPPSAT